MGVIAETTDRVAVLYAGRLAEIGKTSAVLKNPRHPYTKGLVAATPRIDANSFEKRLFQIPGAMPDLENIPQGCAFHPRCDFANAQCKKQQPPLFEDRSACWLSSEGSETS
jgi:peptide/nickel transport system ATP-binding protein